MTGKTVSRAALLDLRNERGVVEDGHRFLDEKRALLAHAVLDRLPALRTALAKCREGEGTAREMLAEAIGVEGLEALQLRSPAAQTQHRVEQRVRSFLGIRIAEDARLETAGAEETEDAGASGDLPLPEETERCRAAYAAIVRDAVPVAVELANLFRLMREFQRTQRRVRALEKVVLPELRDEEKRMEDALEEVEQEDAVRVRLARRDNVH